MRRPARLCAAASVLLLAGQVWTIGPDIALRYPETYVLPDRTRNVAILLGWCAVGCALLAFALHRGLLRSRWWPRLAGAAVVGCAGALAWLVRADARDGPTIDFGFVAGTGTYRWLVVVLAGLAVPAVLAAVAGRLLSRRART